MAVRAERLQLGGGHGGGAPQPHGAHGQQGRVHGGLALAQHKQGHGAVHGGGLGALLSPAASPSRAPDRDRVAGQRGFRALRPLNALCAAKRKSAVELLQESKAFYVKSDCVRERQQRLQRPASSPPCSSTPLGGLAGAAAGAGATPVALVPSPVPPPVAAVMPLSSALLSPPPSPSPLSSPCAGAALGLGVLGAEPMPPAPPGFQQETPTPPSPRALLLPKSPRLGGAAGTTWAQRRAASHQLQSDRLQNKLRRLLNADSKENVFYDAALGREDDGDDARTVAGERALVRAYGRSNSQTHHAHAAHAQAWSGQGQGAGALHKSLPDLHASPTPARPAAPRWSDNSSNRGSSTSSHSGDGDGCGYADYMHRRSGSQRGSRSLHYSGDAMSVVSSGGRTHQSHRSQPTPAAREHCGELRRGGSSGSSSGARTHRSQPEGRSRANTVSEVLIRQSSGASSTGLSGMSSWSPRYNRSRPSSQYHNMRNTSAEELEGSRGSRGSRGSLGSRGSSHRSDHENYSSPPQCSRVAELCWNFEPRRPILRSKSDISHRYSGSVNAPLSPPCQDPAQLEQFFEQLGLDNSEFRYVSRTRSNSSDSPVFFSSVSSIDSNNGGWTAPWSAHGNALSSSAGGTTGTPAGMMGSGHSGKNIEQPSIVERNARIIKWLCNCRKAQKEMYQALGNGNVT